MLVFSLELKEDEDFEANPAARFISDEAYDRAILADLHKAVPKKYHDDMHNKSEFARSVRYIMVSALFHASKYLLVCFQNQ